MTLKEILKMPFGVTLNSEKIAITAGNKAILCADTLGETYTYHYLELREEFKDFLQQALNKKLDRDFGEKKRWQCFDTGYCLILSCPNCEFDKKLDDEPNWKYNQYCPCCGIPLDPPEEK
jgi:hypothetical protein